MQQLKPLLSEFGPEKNNKYSYSPSAAVDPTLCLRSHHQIKKTTIPLCKKNLTQVIDPMRENNGGIIFSRLRMSYYDLTKAVDRM